jgi:hypothetical protein
VSGLLAGKVWLSNLQRELKPLAATLADIANDDGTSIYPSVGYVAWRLSCSERSVQAGLAQLRTAGILERVANQFGGRTLTTEYRLIEAKLPTREPWCSKRKGENPAPFLPSKTDRKGAFHDTKGCNLRQEMVKQAAPDPSLSVSETSCTPTAEPSAPGVCEASRSAEASVEAETKDVAFSMFWEKWPRRQARADARRAWRKIPMAEYPVVMTALEKWLTSDQWSRGVIPHPATWLNEKRWLDEDIPQFGGINGTYTASGKPNASDLALRNARALGLDGRLN